MTAVGSALIDPCASAAACLVMVLRPRDTLLQHDVVPKPTTAVSAGTITLTTNAASTSERVPRRRVAPGSGRRRKMIYRESRPANHHQANYNCPSSPASAGIAKIIGADRTRSGHRM
jgi:hypothetical protein